jgi:two-component system, OmpR family, phosphate regulon sensor histidine kinase PhoR
MSVRESQSVGNDEQVTNDLRRANEFHVALLAMAGHDLRQPLQVLLSSYDWLSQRVDKDLAWEYLDRGQSAITQLIEQLDHLVSALRLHGRESGIEGVPVALGSIFAALERNQRDFANLKDVRLDIVPTQATLISDELLLEGILRNLTRNALKYTQRHGRVLVGCRSRGTESRIEVHDTGVGMPPDKLASVFHAFYRLDATQPNGLGLGLFVVRRAADLLGHRVEVCSTLGRGSCFTVVAKAAARSSAHVA